MTKRSLLFAAAFAALTAFGSTANAAFTYATSSSITGTPTGTSSPSFVDTATTTVTGTAAIANVNVIVSGTASSAYNFTLNTTYIVNNTNAATLATVYTVNTDGTFVAGAQTLTVLASAPAGFTFSSPKATDGDNTGNTTAATSLRINQTAVVPEPASLAMVGLGLAGVGGLALRRRTK